MPDLKALKKQAKLILRWHKDRYHPVAATIRDALPKFQTLSDQEILDRAFKLADAQELVARQHGFQSWQALKTGFSNMPDNKRIVSAKPVISSAKPQLWVTDLQRAIDFYTQKLGFNLTIHYGEPPFYAHVERDDATLIFRHVDISPIDSAERDKEMLLAAEMSVDDVKALFLEYQAAGVSFHSALKKQPWGAKNFIIRDPDGNLLLFAGRDE